MVLVNYPCAPCNPWLGFWWFGVKVELEPDFEHEVREGTQRAEGWLGGLCVRVFLCGLYVKKVGCRTRSQKGTGSMDS